MKVADKTKKTAPKNEELTAIPSLEPRLGRVYSNYVQISHTKYDFTIRFGDAPPGGDLQRLRRGNEVTIPNIVEIVIVPDLIPEIIKALETNYSRFIEQFRDIAKETEEN
ncbi:MAG: hypothetical protein COS90_10315 [Deltaproteobacteria bacterium CG07_land_8_20_14_0_80_60_11]|nr:MAG: hypothetical protein COS90_10315 [Deltaproteobacteria bacterium CG07_land_8_20_14_0_80_60_11]